MLFMKYEIVKSLQKLKTFKLEIRRKVIRFSFKIYPPNQKVATPQYAPDNHNSEDYVDIGIAGALLLINVVNSRSSPFTSSTIIGFSESFAAL